MIHHYVVVRTDIEVGLLAAMVAHAAGETGGERAVGAHVVVLAAKDGEMLEQASRALAKAGVAHRMIREPDPPWDGAAMAIGIAPFDRLAEPAGARALSSLPLFRRIG